MNLQNTIKETVTLRGVGLHTGQEITLSISPAHPGQGIIFCREDVKGKDSYIPALWDRVVDTQLCTVIANDDGVRVGTIEHLMAALRGMHIDNALITLDGEEVPIMDGSSMPFIEEIQKVGIQSQNKTRRVVKILKPVSVRDGDKIVSLSPSDDFSFGGTIDFDHPTIGRQQQDVQLVNGNFVHDLAEARTFGFVQEVEYLRSQGLARGGSLDNAIVLDQDGVMNKGGLRFADEFIRHKLLDAIGDLYLAGAPILGAYESYKGGHAINNAILRELFSDDSNWMWAEEGETEEVAPYLLTRDVTSPALATRH